MPTFSATVCKINGTGVASVTVELLPSDELEIRCNLTSPVQVDVTEGKPFESVEIEVICMSGARYARNVFHMSKSRIVIRAAKGAVAPLDIQAFAIATVLAIGRALGKEDLIPAKALEGTSGSWKSCEARLG